MKFDEIMAKVTLPCTAFVLLLLGIPLQVQAQSRPTGTVVANISDLDIQLVNGSARNEGRVLIRWSPVSPWSAVCYDPSFSHVIPFQICRRLGYPFACGQGYAGARRTDEDSLVNVNSEFLRVTCIADQNSRSFGGCTLSPMTGLHGFGMGPPCTHDRDMWISCGYAGMPDFELRLVTGTYEEHAGLLQGRCGPEHEWSAICGNEFYRLKQGRVACRELGYSDLAAGFDFLAPDRLDANHRPNYTLSVDIGCVGDEASLTECQHYSLRECDSYVTLECFTVITEFDETGYLCGSKQLCGDQCKQDHPIKGSNDKFHYCQCDDACGWFNDCCYDYERECSQSSQRPPSLGRGGFTVDRFGCVWVPGSQFTHIGFVAVDLCPISWTDDGTRDLCERPVNVTDVIGSLPLYDDLDVDFKNVYCAICNGRSLDRLRWWDISASDNERDITDHMFYPSFNSTLPSKGWIVTPPRGNGVLRRCSAHLVDTCREDFRGSRLEAGCKAYYAPVKVADSDTRYRNPHCAMCHGKAVLPDQSCIDQACTGECDPSPWGPCFFLCGPYDRFNTIEVLFDLFSSSSTTGVSCTEGQIYDPFLERCRVLMCAAGYHISGEECVVAPTTGPRLFSNVSDTAVALCLLDVFADNTAARNVIEAGQYRATIDMGSWTWSLSVLVNSANQALEVTFNVDLSFNFYNDSQQDLSLPCNISTFSIFLPFSFNGSGTCANSTVVGSEIFPEFIGTLLAVTEYKDTADQRGYTKITASSLCLDITYLNCTSFVTLERSEYLLNIDGSIEIDVTTDVSLPEAEYVLFPDGTVVFCSLTEGLEPKIRRAISFAGSCLSLLALAATFVTYCIFSELRNTAGKCIMNLVVALFVAILLFLLAGVLAENQAVCEFGSAVSHFAWLAAFLWMTMLAVDVARTLTSKIPRGGSTARCSPSFVTYMSLAWGIPLVIVTICLVLQYCDCTSLPKIYAEGTVCWITDATVRLVTFVAPVVVSLALNLSLFVFTVVSVRRSREAAKVARKQGKMESAREELSIYAKLSALLGVTWVFGFLTQSVTGILPFSYIHIILNYFQGVFIFIAFCLNKRVRGLWRQKFGRRRGKQKGGATSNSKDKAKSSNVTGSSTNEITRDTKL